MRLVLFEPDIAQNAGTLFRLAACLHVPVDLIEPCGFHLDDRRMRRAALDYLAALDLTRHRSWQAYARIRTAGSRAESAAAGASGPGDLEPGTPDPGTPDPGTAKRGPGRGRLVLLTTHAERPYTAFAFRADDSIMVGRESAGVPDEVHRAADARLRIPMHPGLRSINVALAAAMVLGEALRQTGQLPGDREP